MQLAQFNSSHHIKQIYNIFSRFSTYDNIFAKFIFGNKLTSKAADIQYFIKIQFYRLKCLHFNTNELCAQRTQVCGHNSTNMGHSPNDVSMLAHRHRRWTHIETLFGECSVFAGKTGGDNDCMSSSIVSSLALSSLAQLTRVAKSMLV